MRVYKSCYRDRQGKAREASKWYIEFRDHAETVRRIPAFTDKAQSEQAGRNIEKLVAARINHEPLDGALARWFGGLPTKMQETLAGWGVVEGKAVVGRKSLDQHLAEFADTLRSSGRTEKHVTTTTNRLHRAFEQAKFQSWNDIDAERFAKFLARERAQGLSVKCSNYYVQAAKQFCRWMIDTNRATSNPLERLGRLKIDVETTRPRRALSTDELNVLLAHTDAEPARFGMPGSERALLYRVAAETGLRANELRSLTRSSFRFARAGSTVTVEARSSKRRRRDELPIRPELATELQQHLSNKLPAAVAFTMPKSDKTARMLRTDLEAARDSWLKAAPNVAERSERERSSFLSYQDDEGNVADFHSLRHRFCTSLALAGVAPAVARDLARHSDVNLTLKTYAHVSETDLREALDLLPTVTGQSPESARMTGTDGGRTSNSVLASCWALLDSEQSADLHSCAVLAGPGTNKNGSPQVAGEPWIYAENTASDLKEAPVRVELTLADLQSDYMGRKTRKKVGFLNNAQRQAQQSAQRSTATIPSYGR